MQLTFLNLSDGAKLNRDAAKRVRGHVTRTNFAHRRRKNRNSGPQGRKVTCPQDAVPKEEVQIVQSSCPRSPSEPDIEIRYRTFPYETLSLPSVWLTLPVLCEYRPLIFPTAMGQLGSPCEKHWISLLRSEPALVYASMAIAVKHGSWPFPFHQADTDKRYALDAIRLVSSRLGSADGLSDGLLGAVFTLSYSEVSLESPLKFLITNLHHSYLPTRMPLETCISTALLKWWPCAGNRVNTIYRNGLPIFYYSPSIPA